MEELLDQMEAGTGSGDLDAAALEQRVFATLMAMQVRIKQALQEAIRVCRPHGRLAFAVFIETNYQALPWFRDWFSPIGTLAERMGVTPTIRLHRPGEVSESLRALGAVGVETEQRQSTWIARTPETTVAHLIQATDFFAGVMRRLPWQARVALVEELVERGKKVVARYSEEERTLDQPVELVRARAGTRVRSQTRTQ